MSSSRPAWEECGLAKICLQIRENKKRIRKAPNEFITMEPLTKTCSYFLSQVAAKTAEAPPRDMGVLRHVLLHLIVHLFVL